MATTRHHSMTSLMKEAQRSEKKRRFSNPVKKSTASSPNDYFTSVPDWYRMQMDPYHPEFAMLDKPPHFEEVDVPAVKQVMRESEQAWQECYSPEDFGYQVREEKIVMRDGGEITARIYRPLTDDAPDMPMESLPMLLVAHGGLFGGGPIYEEIMSLRPIMLNFHLVIVNVHYRAAPEFPIPTALHDLYDTLGWSVAHKQRLGIDADRVYIYGSAQGGTISASLNLMLRFGCNSAEEFTENYCDKVFPNPPAPSPEKVAESLEQVLSLESNSSTASSFEPVRMPKDIVKGVILSTAVLCHPSQFPYELEPTSSYVQCYGTFGLNTGLLRQAWSRAAPALEVDATCPLVSPLLAKPNHTKDFPPHLMIVAGQDPLRDEGIAYARMLRERGIKCDLKIYKGVPHCFAGFENLKSTKLFWDNLVQSMAGEFKLKIRPTTVD